MSREQTLQIAVYEDVAPRVRELQESAAACLRRLESAQPGDGDGELERYELIQSEIESIAYAELWRPADDTLSESNIVLTVTWPFHIGFSEGAPPSPGTPIPPREPWRSKTASGKSRDKNERAAVVLERLSAQMQAWIDLANNSNSSISDPPPICPSGIANRPLAEALRKFVDAGLASRAVEARVQYQDGSSARPLHLASLNFSPEMPDDRHRVMRVTLLSVRHLEMDVDVDGAWLRNREISVSRPAGQTDELAYQASLRQLRDLTVRQPLALHMYQTGLPPANVGFYRAVIDHNRLGSGQPVAVFPWYYQGPNPYLPGTMWRVAR